MPISNSLNLAEGSIYQADPSHMDNQQELDSLLQSSLQEEAMPSLTIQSENECMDKIKQIIEDKV